MSHMGFTVKVQESFINISYFNFILNNFFERIFNKIIIKYLLQY